MQRHPLSVALTAALLAGACSHESFVPAEKIAGASPDGYVAAEYDLSTKDGDIGEVRVWSSGADRVVVRGGEQTILHVGFEVDNASDQPVRMPADGLRLESVGLADTVLEGIPVSRIEGPDVIGPRESARVHATFIMPSGVEPDDLDNFRLRWELRSNGTTYAEWTPFVEDMYAYDRYAYAPAYDPYYRGAFGPPAYGTLYGYPYVYPYPYWY